MIAMSSTAKKKKVKIYLFWGANLRALAVLAASVVFGRLSVAAAGFRLVVAVRAAAKTAERLGGTGEPAAAELEVGVGAGSVIVVDDGQSGDVDVRDRVESEVRELTLAKALERRAAVLSRLAAILEIEALAGQRLAARLVGRAGVGIHLVAAALLSLLETGPLRALFKVAAHALLANVGEPVAAVLRGQIVAPQIRTASLRASAAQPVLGRRAAELVRRRAVPAIVGAARVVVSRVAARVHADLLTGQAIQCVRNPKK